MRRANWHRGAVPSGRSGSSGARAPAGGPDGTKRTRGTRGRRRPAHRVCGAASRGPRTGRANWQRRSSSTDTNPRTPPTTASAPRSWLDVVGRPAGPGGIAPPADPPNGQRWSPPSGSDRSRRGSRSGRWTCRLRDGLCPPPQPWTAAARLTTCPQARSGEMDGGSGLGGSGLTTPTGALPRHASSGLWACGRARTGRPRAGGRPDACPQPSMSTGPGRGDPGRLPTRP